MSTISSQYVHMFLKQHSIEVKAEDASYIHSELQEHITSLVYNVTSIAMVMALLNDSRKVNTKHLTEVRKYILSHCPLSSSQKGGESMPSEFYGVATPNYASSNNEATVTSLVKFEDGIARPALGSLEIMTGGKTPSSHDKCVVAYIKAVLKQQNATIVKAALHELLAIIEIHLSCLANDLRTPTALTKSKFAKVMQRKRHAVFQ